LLEEAYGAEVDIFGGRSGSFEITAEGDLVYSKLTDHRFPEDDEVRHLLDGR
jgi:selT/selW/selH-like putative selenoprotein